jgi:glycine hydroxymethyltransferase
MSSLSQADMELAKLVMAEQRRQTHTLELIASENHASPAVLEAMGSILTDKYAEGYPNRRWYCGCENMDAIEQLAIDRAKQLFGAEYANVQPHCGTSANLGVYLAALKPGSKIMGMRLDQGGHLSHGLNINLSGICYKAVHYGVRQDTEMLDMDQVRSQALSEKPDMLVVGASAYSRQIDFAAFAAIAKEAGCLMMADIAHIAGLVAAGVHPSPFPHADFVTTTTHKTLRGPRGGIILCKSRWAKAIDSAIFPGLQGGPLMHVVAAKATAFKEAMHPDFHAYAQAIIANAKVLAQTLASAGWRLVSGGTDNHLFMIDLRSRDAELSGKTAANWLAQAGLIANKNAIPFDTRPPIEASGIRIGTPALTTRGMRGDEMKMVGLWIDQVLTSKGDHAVVAKVKAGVEELCERFPIPNHVVHTD